MGLGVTSDRVDNAQAEGARTHHARWIARYDQTGLIWLLQGRRVVELTKDKAVIETATGILSYRRYNKPALGPLGDSLDDFAPAIAANKSDATTVKHHGLPRPVPEFLRKSNV